MLKKRIEVDLDYFVYVIPIRSETSSTMLVAISHASCRRRLHRVGCEKQALSKDL